MLKYRENLTPYEKTMDIKVNHYKQTNNQRQQKFTKRETRTKKTQNIPIRVCIKTMTIDMSLENPFLSDNLLFQLATINSDIRI